MQVAALPYPNCRVPPCRLRLQGAVSALCLCAIPWASGAADLAPTAAEFPQAGMAAPSAATVDQAPGNSRAMQKGGRAHTWLLELYVNGVAYRYRAG